MKKTVTSLMVLFFLGLIRGVSFAQTADVCDPAVPDVTPPAIGFRADYYAGLSFNSFKYSEYVSAISFHWEGVAPDSTLLAPGNYSVRYTGAIIVPVSGTYNFYTTSNSGARLYINDRLSIENWTAKTVTAGSRTMYLEAGKLMKVRLEYASSKPESGQIKLEWQRAGTARQIIQYSDTQVGNSLTVALNAQGKASITADDVDPGFIDACGVASLTLDKTSFDCSNLGVNKVTLVATDVNGNSSTVPATITIIDNIPPAITAPADLTVSQGAKINLGAPVTSDICAGVQVSHDAPETFPVGVTTVTWTATDASGNKATATQLVTIKEVSLALSAPEKIVKVNDAGKAGAVVAYEVTANGNASGVTISQSAGLLSGSLFPVGVTENTFEATDAAGNTASASFTVIVEDKEAPVATVAQLATLTGECQVAVTAVPTAQDNTDGTIKAFTTDALSYDVPGTYTITWTYADSHGNTSTQNQTVLVNSLATPAISVNRTDNTFTGSNAETIILGYGAQSLNLSASVVVAGVSYSWSVTSPAGAAGLSSTSGSSTVFSPTKAGSYEVTLTAANGTTCSASAAVTITVIDVRCDSNGNKTKVLVCHNGKVICVAKEAVAAHLKHTGDALGNCGTAGDGDKADDSNETDDKRLTALPNPFTNRTTVEFTPSKAGDFTVELYDMQGKLKKVVGKGKAKANQSYKFEVEASSYDKGVYLLRVATGSEVITKRLVVNK